MIQDSRKETKKLEWVDVHTHLHLLDIPAEEAIQAAKENGVTTLFTIGTEPKDWPEVNKHAKIFPAVKGALGVHPHCANVYNDSVEENLSKQLNEAHIQACGEIGLDYYYENSDRKAQQNAFRRQMALAEAKKLPVEIHTRSAEADTLCILKEFQVPGLLHCFTGSWSLAKAAMDLGFGISFSGIISFKNANDLRETCKKVPLDSLHLETDAPYLAPVPHRGKQNQPAYLIHTAEVIAQLKNIPLEQLSHITKQNKNKLFR